MTTHRAALLQAKTTRFTMSPVPTPTPGPGELLIQVKALAINPVDTAQRDKGFPPIPSYPAVIGSDVSGIVVSTGPDVPDSAPQPGSRVTAMASSFYTGKMQYGAFQEFVLAGWNGVIPLPESLSFEDAAVFPLASLAALSGFTTIGIPLDARFTTEDKRAVLLWGGASSVGTMAIQFARQMGLVVYTTASAKNHEYLKSLGAHRTFDYHNADVVSQIVDAVKEDGVTLTDAQTFAWNSLQSVLDVLKETKGDKLGKVGHAPPLLPDAPSMEGVEVKFVLPPMEPAAREQHKNQVFHGWLKPGLENGTVVPSPQVQLVEGGLEGLNAALDIIKDGVSATKLVVKV
ncbi:zinc-binding alcohol dehydrogenase family protein [Aspergillus mulundensis]|uniref:Enoyl reductase (ER) domain-containing protein n=1 Tax=Aspergillus mulundensis TaxID=1810919 RepID=A0A3D8RZK6_9EURO|nr:Uncharacterized protein DSM5745_06136 [Aspergillus mulundensis]RDW79284.1 Uncharacterized protein DSM5745_06136 [Aspergillus mulundensis]